MICSFLWRLFSPHHLSFHPRHHPGVPADVSAFFCTTFFGVGWWIFLNAASLHSSSTVPIPFSFYLPIIGQLLSFFMINLPAWSAISGDDSAAYDDANRVLCINRGIVMFGLFLEMSCVAGKCVS